LACGAFGRLFGVDWPAFIPVVIGAATGQWIRHALIARKQNIFITSGIVSFASAFLAGFGARLSGSAHLETATAAGFGILFNCPPRMIWQCFCSGVAALAVRTVGQTANLNLAEASFFAALFVATAERVLQQFQFYPERRRNHADS
jgi:uncharacterized membrane protein YjjB (DUF3815 family)